MSGIKVLVALASVCACVAGPLAAQASRPTENAATKPTLAVVGFAVKGDVPVKGAGEVLAELMQARIGPDRYQVIERLQLARLLKEADLELALVRDNPEKVLGKLRGVQYLVLGSVNRVESYTVAVRLVEVATGNVIQTAEWQGKDAADLEDSWMIGELARVLQMSAVEKKAYFDETQYPAVLAAARKAVADNQRGQAASLYRRALAIRLTTEVQGELAKVTADLHKEELARAAKLANVRVMVLGSLANLRYGYDYPHDAHNKGASETNPIADELASYFRRKGIKLAVPKGMTAAAREGIVEAVLKDDLDEAVKAAKNAGADIVVVFDVKTVGRPGVPNGVGMGSQADVTVRIVSVAKSEVQAVKTLGPIMGRNDNNWVDAERDALKKVQDQAPPQIHEMVVKALGDASQ